MKIIADADILDVSKSLSDLGELELISGREIQARHLADADALIVRSITQVDESLLKNSKIRFVGTATSGSNHIDTEYLSRKGIEFVDAKGSNANAVVDYFFSALAFAVVHKSLDIDACTVGIVGGGKVGGLLAKKLKLLSIPFKICDPPLDQLQCASEEETKTDYYSLGEVMACEVVTLHVPLSHSGEFPTASLISNEQLGLLPKNGLMVNACRGGVVDEQDLIQFLKNREDVSTVFDVWENEPSPNKELLELVDIATPHIAGYSREAKAAATEMMRKAIYAYLGKEEKSLEENPEQNKFNLELPNLDNDNVWNSVLKAMPVMEISSNFKSAASSIDGDKVFDKIRAELRSRREFGAIHLIGKSQSELSPAKVGFLGALGFSFQG